MTTTDWADVGAEGASDLRFAHWAAVRRGALVLYFASLIAWSAVYGIPVQRELVVLWICGALACASLGRPPREILQLVLDWLPMVVVLSAYDFSRGAADSFGIGVHVHPMIDFDRFLFFGTTPSEWLQAHLQDPKVVNWLDVAFTLIYTSYFIVPFTVAHPTALTGLMLPPKLSVVPPRHDDSAHVEKPVVVGVGPTPSAWKSNPVSESVSCQPSRLRCPSNQRTLFVRLAMTRSTICGAIPR